MAVVDLDLQMQAIVLQQHRTLAARHEMLAVSAFDGGLPAWECLVEERLRIGGRGPTGQHDQPHIRAGKIEP